MTDWPFDTAFFRRMEGLRLQSRRRVISQSPGERRGPRKGSGLEFFDFRSYVQGDDWRYIDWNIYSRLDRLIVKLFSEEKDLCLHLLIDTSASMAAGSATKLGYALCAAAALGYIALANHERLAVGLFNDQLFQVLQPHRGRRQIFPLIRFLARIHAAGQTDLHTSIKRYALQSRTPGVAILISDLFDAEQGYQAGIKALLARGFEVHLLHLLAEEELHPTLDGDLRLIDSENGIELETNIDSRAREKYRLNLQSFCDEAAHFCRHHSVAYLRLSSATPFEDLIWRWLREKRFLQ